jgi:hypothetical protein
VNAPIVFVSPATVTVTGTTTGENPTGGGLTGGVCIVQSLALLQETSTAGTDIPFMLKTMLVAPGAVANLAPWTRTFVPPSGGPFVGVIKPIGKGL